MRTRIKICGITNPDDASAIVDVGADGIGLMFYKRSSRFVSIQQAIAIAEKIPSLVDLVGVFVDPSEEEVNAVLDRVPLSILQFHGNESADFCEGFGRPYIKAMRMADQVDPQTESLTHPKAGAFLLDTFNPDAHGGTGETFEWSRARANLASPIILAGGLTAANVGTALSVSNAWGVDTSSGVEKSPGVKDIQKIETFCRAVQEWDRNSRDKTAQRMSH
ncbi:phosphoribosylanthranilate isomerase [Arenicellales bacterium nBUS_48]|nr:phosphoribosylanthranilate isomerase [Pseudomonadota bacterium]